MIPNEGMGIAEKQLRLKLVKNYFKLLYENDNLPESICFYGDGVKLTLKNSPVIEICKLLQEEGVKLFVCKTCLKYYNIEDKISFGNVGSMLDIIDEQRNADKVITI